jgi:hypothetical protein
MGKTVGQFISELKASRFEWQDAPNMVMVIVRKLDSKEMLEEISIWAGIKGRAESLGGDNGRSHQAGFVQTGLMQEVLHKYTSWQSCGNFWLSCHEADILTTEVVIIFCKAGGMVWPIEWLSNG